ncbi:MAG: antibiotic biosynthesis monooxygenase [Saprospiraceae bacterium]|nr:antibiotic biosynthesis monooxygenase [Pyrinomonadaceae bacterium]
MVTNSEGTVLVLEHIVKRGREKRYEKWLTDISAVLKAAPGFIGREVFPPSLPDRPYIIVIRFETGSALREWLDSAEHIALRFESRDMLDQSDRPSVASGFDLWLAPEPNPKRYKLLLITVAAIFLLSLLMPRVLEQLFDTMAPNLKNSTASGLIQTAIIVALMSYAVMPHLTHWLRRWLLPTAVKKKKVQSIK